MIWIDYYSQLPYVANEKWESNRIVGTNINIYKKHEKITLKNSYWFTALNELNYTT